MPHVPMDDKDIAQDLLAQIKGISRRVHTTVLESAHPQVRQTLEQIDRETENLAGRVFNFVSQRGWYNPRLADQQTVAWFQNAISQVQQTARQAQPVTLGGAQAGLTQGGLRYPSPTAYQPYVAQFPQPLGGYGSMGMAASTSPTAGATGHWGQFQSGGRQYGPY